MKKEIKIIADELDVYADGITKMATKAGDVVAVEEELAASMIKAGQAVLNDGSEPEAPATPAATAKPKAPEDMNKAELKAFAATQGIELDDTKTKADMLAAYHEALAAK